MDESAYAEALDVLDFDEHKNFIHYYDSDQEEKSAWDSLYFLLYDIKRFRIIF